MIVYIIVIYMNYSSCKIIFFLSEKRKKARICILYPCFCSKVTREKVYEYDFFTKKSGADTVADPDAVATMEKPTP